ncbi:hypothetical protein A2291_00300 [candidate division WOR-1 bacterium RIFOXYB2_FULL_42_35]|uniref:AAA+ ATPase domain-containing protein n=1 Tax=candidate division WOR-1 bacterium RIFOXYC2_FULL_41_25 TaxID=1802586 RepID=A0A1F4TMI9_UNCSA|nr:MAG: hypothetical protein A2247_01435 [candidate division WOR-1 bacterium RIFOXYA2_FULL_41_14]OGC24261.1 MAG: hypothetical protein A2291_00300 [candidate division WOR-1 bacterium RIFOXYB2_FULL_42_35]OGC33904.1 MAG: hypothetical protein A2462_01270 [candidate division WOR-1 bacterium RIFOXYC2_FULL_41_25]OGC43903.1 MAG: hypothetical protein A2548_02850 [candidate division WOR-1 bacterium RIFOXYD2_FULL_41_8]
MKAGVKLPPRVAARELKGEITKWLKREEIIVITGARQTGKSVLLYQLILNDILPKTTAVHYFNLDVPKHLEFFQSPDKLIALANKSKGKTYVIIDEVQRLKEPGLFLKGVYDLHLPLKIIVSGSSALEIKSKIHEALTGRKVLFHLHPFNLKELCWALFPKEKFEKIVKDKQKFALALDHFLTYGGYPAVVMAKSKKLKLALLAEVFQSYLEKDVKAFLKVENETAFMNLLKLLASQVGSLTNKEELSNSLGIHKNTLDNYLFYLEQTFILDFIRPFYKNPRKELLKNPKVYFNDLGIRNFAVSTFGKFEYRPDKGVILENFAYLSLKKLVKYANTISFWRTKAGAEVDFILVDKMQPIPFEVKATRLEKFKISRSFRSFLLTYKPTKAFCLNLSLSETKNVGATKISFLTPQDLILL